MREDPGVITSWIRLHRVLPHALPEIIQPASGRNLVSLPGSWVWMALVTPRIPVPTAPCRTHIFGAGAPRGTLDILPVSSCVAEGPTCHSQSARQARLAPRPVKVPPRVEVQSLAPRWTEAIASDARGAVSACDHGVAVVRS